MKKEVSTKKLLEALLHSYIETHDLGQIYNGDGTLLTTLDQATKFIDGLKGETMIEKYTMPCIHMNGSDEDSLRRQYNELFDAVSQAQINSFMIQTSTREITTLLGMRLGIKLIKKERKLRKQ